jgi:hypothetical protein
LTSSVSHCKSFHGQVLHGNTCVWNQHHDMSFKSYDIHHIQTRACYDTNARGRPPSCLLGMFFSFNLKFMVPLRFITGVGWLSFVKGHV